MTTDIESSNIESAQARLCARLKSEREALGLTQKQISGSLKLTEKVIGMIEENAFPENFPPTFLRGYLRSYAKVLNLPLEEVNSSLGHFESAAKPTTPSEEMQLAPALEAPYFARPKAHWATFGVAMTFFVIFTLWFVNRSTTADTHTTNVAINTETPSTPLVLSASQNPTPAPNTNAAAPEKAPTKKIVHAYANTSDADGTDDNDTDSDDNDSN